MRILPSKFNYPTHLVDQMPSDPVVLHYHGHIDDAGFLRITGHDAADAKIRRINRILAAERRSVSQR